MNSSARHNRLGEAGISLIDVCIALILISVIIVPLAQQYHQYQIDRINNTTQANLGSVDHALVTYYFANKSYPCPADPKLSNADAGYGKADCDATKTAGGEINLGAVPFVDLKIPFTQALDGYKNKIVYAVTTAQTVLPMANSGAITLTGLDRSGAQVNPLGEKNVTDPVTGVSSVVSNKAHYLIFSAGRDGAGAYTALGQQFAECPSSDILEAANCDGDKDFVGGDSTYSINQANKERFSDDIIYSPYRVEAPSSIWMTSAKDRKNIFSNVKYIGINTNNPQVDLDVNGNILTKDANTIVVRMCDDEIPDDAADDICFHPKKIAGTGMGCDEGAMTGIQRDDAVCDRALSAAAASSCPQYTYPVGFDDTGALICE